MFWIFLSIIQNKPVIRTITMAFYTYIYAPKQTQLSWVWDNFVGFINSTQIFREHVISGLSLSLRFVSNHQPRLSFYRLIKVMPKSMKFKGKRSQDKIRHILIFDEEQNVQFTFCEKRPILFTKSLWFHGSVNQCCRSAPVRAIYTPGGPRTTYHPGPFRGPRGRGKAAGRHPWIPYGSRYIYWLKSAKEIARYPAVCRPVPGRASYATRRVFFTGCVRATGLNKNEQRPWHTGARTGC